MAVLTGKRWRVLNWRRERFVWVPREASGRLQGASFDLRALVTYLAKFADKETATCGKINLGEQDVFASLCALCRVEIPSRRAFKLLVQELLDSGVAEANGRVLRLVEFAAWQRTREPVRRIYCNESPSFERLSAYTRFTAMECVRIAHDDGTVFAGTPDEFSHHFSHSASRYDRTDARRAFEAKLRERIASLIADGFLGVENGTLRVRNFEVAQTRYNDPKQEKRQPKSTATGDALDTRPSRAQAAVEPRSNRARTAVEPCSTRPQAAVEPRSNRAQAVLDTSSHRDSPSETPAKWPERPAKKSPLPTIPSLPSLPPSIEGKEGTRGDVRHQPAAEPLAEAEPEKISGGQPERRGGRGRRVATTLPNLDPVPAEGSEVRAIFDAIVCDEAIRPIVVGPGDFSQRLARDFPALTSTEIAGCVRDAGSWMVGKRVKRDGRAFLRNWVRREAEAKALRPQPARASAAPVFAPARHTGHGPLPSDDFGHLEGVAGGRYLDPFTGQEVLAPRAVGNC